MSGVASTGSYHLLRRLGARAHPTHAAARGAQEIVVVQCFALAGEGGDPESIAAIGREARGLAKNWHANVARVRHVEHAARLSGARLVCSPHEASELVITTDLIDGVTLEDLVTLGKASVPPPVLVRIMLDVLAGLQHFHSLRDETNAAQQLGAVHGAVCPANVVIGKDGVARLVGCFRPRPSKPGVATKTEALGHSAPEVLETGIPGAAGDLYGCGVMLWEGLQDKPLFTTTSPFEASAILQRQREGDIAWSADAASLGARLGAVVLRALAFDPALRFRTAQELATAIRRAAGTEIATASRVGARVVEVAGDRIRARRMALVNETIAATTRGAKPVPLVAPTPSPPPSAVAQAPPVAKAAVAKPVVAKPPAPKPATPKPPAIRPIAKPAPTPVATAATVVAAVMPEPPALASEPEPTAPIAIAFEEIASPPPAAPSGGVAFRDRPTPPSFPVEERLTPTPFPVAIEAIQAAPPAPAPLFVPTPAPSVRDLGEAAVNVPLLQRGIPLARAAQIVGAAIVITLLLIFLVVKTRTIGSDDGRMTSSEPRTPARRESPPATRPASATTSNATPLPSLPAMPGASAATDPPAPDDKSAVEDAPATPTGLAPIPRDVDANAAPDPSVAAPAPTAPPKKRSYDPLGI